MQKRFYLLSLMISSVTSVHAEATHTKPITETASQPTAEYKKFEVKRAKVCSSKIFSITQKDVGQDGYPPIKEPGIYKFKENISWCPIKNGTHTKPVAAFKIQTCNVKLDLDGFTFRQKGKATNTVGVFITNDKPFTDTISKPIENVIVRNGAIENIATAGILVSHVNVLLLENLFIKKNGNRGYILSPALTGNNRRAGGIIYPTILGEPIQHNHIWDNVHCDFNGPNQDPSVDIHGFVISGTDTLFLCNGSNDNNISTSSSKSDIIFGFFEFDRNIKVENWSLNGNQAPEGRTFMGMDLLPWQSSS